MNQELKSKLSEIVGIVEDLPEPYKRVAFEEILRVELSNLYKNSIDNFLKQEKNSENYESKDIINKWEADLLRDLPEAYKVADNGSRDQQTMWGVITLHGRGEQANNDSVRKILRDELGIPPQSKSNTARTLRNLTPKFLTREKEGKTYLYRPTRNSIKIFDDLINNPD